MYIQNLKESLKNLKDKQYLPNKVGQSVALTHICNKATLLYKAFVHGFHSMSNPKNILMFCNLLNLPYLNNKHHG